MVYPVQSSFTENVTGGIRGIQIDDFREDLDLSIYLVFCVYIKE